MPRYLCLDQTEFDDEDVAVLAELPRLRTLHLREGGFTDEGLTRLGKLKQLRELMVVMDCRHLGGAVPVGMITAGPGRSPNGPSPLNPRIRCT